MTTRRRGLALLFVAILAIALVVGVLAWARDADGIRRIDVSGLLARLTDAPTTDGVNPVDAASGLDQVAFLRFVVDDIQDTWSQTFGRAGLSYPRTQLVVFEDRVRSGCGAASAETGPFYCPIDQRVYLDQAFFAELADRYGAPGDFAQAYVIAHEFGHHVQAVLGVTLQVARLQQARPDLAALLSVRTELQADCLAGVWGHSAYEQHQVEPGDLEEAVTAAAAVGDDRSQAASEGVVNPDAFTHGTSEQRVTWFLEGFRGGDPDGCDTFRRDDP